ncbi:MAG TPA: multifunctional CCA addition/repair protein [Rhodanobacteraceae bacterium]|nr:multifunctional CCA addition/repair protein [Rhodanobacteraceae bacterium]
MDVYLVGGAVRDKLLGRPVADRDFVVVGATPADMLAAGYLPVGKDFPVFLHPDSGEEYALARTERKSGPGYHGFDFHADITVTLEQDLARRDLTINAIAEADDGRLIDPYGGVADLEARVLRHVSPAFVEDPVRLLRVARFAARYAPLGFRVADETMALLITMTSNGEVDHLVPERVWAELRKALAEPQPSAFLHVLRACTALARVLPEVDALYGVPQPAQHHPEIDTGVHVEMALDMAARVAPADDLVGFCVLTHDLGKALTPRVEWPSHHGHEERGVAPLTALAERLRVPAEYQALATVTCRQHLNAHRVFDMRPGSVLRVLESLDALRRPERLPRFLAACEADKRGRGGREQETFPAAAFWTRALTAVRAVDASPFVARGLRGPAIGEAMRQARIEAIAALPRPNR